MNVVMRFSLVIAVTVAGGQLAVAQQNAPKDGDAKPATNAKADGLSAAEIKSLVKQLESGKYKERNEATNKLMSGGKAVIDPVFKAGQTDDLELGARCVDILKHYYQKGDAATKTAAGEALKKLQTSKHRAVAKWAGEALVKPGIAGGLPFNRNRARAGRILGGRVGGIRVAPQLRREAKATDNGKKIHIIDNIGGPNGRQITVKITEKVNGKDKTTVYTATGLADLRRKNRAVYDLYRKHIRGARVQMIAGNNLPIRVQMPQFPGGAGNRRISARTVNGRRELTATEGNRTVRLSDTNGKDIAITVTETKNGKAETKEYKAKDEAELKKKHPQAAKIYEQYKNFGVRGAGFFGGVAPGAIPANALPGQIAPPQVAPAQVRAAGNARVKRDLARAQSQLDAVIKQLQKHALQKNAKPDELKRLAEQVQQARQSLRRATQRLR